eukprot:c29272_g1_i1 orf=315-2657(+)
MLVQEDRTQLRHGALELQNNKPISDVKINFKNGYFRSQLLKKDPALFSKKGTLSEYISDNLSKLAILGLVFLSVLILILVKNRGESSALLCIQPSSKGSQEIAFPNVEFKKVEAVKDTSRFRVVKASKWIVVAVSGPPTEQISAMVKMQGWQVLAIGDSHTPKNWDVRGAIFLSIEQQAALKFRVLAHLPFTSYVRKSVGYLFAIQHGAKIIYDADENASVLGHDLSNVFDLVLSESQSKNETLLQFLPLPKRTTINPYIHFGQRSVWPRGLPLETVSNINADMYYKFVPSGKQLIQQGLANGFPDVDSIFYYTRKGVSESIDIKFDSHAPPVALPRATMAPINHFNTLFHLSAFWALMLPVSVNPQVSDIFRGFWAQRLLWDIGGYLAIYPPSIYRADAMKSHPFEEEKDLHENVDSLIHFLVTWNSNKPTFFERVLDLSHSLAETGFWTWQDVEFTAAWLQDLVSVGYTEPTLFGLDIEGKVPFSGQPDQVEFVPLALPSVYLGVQETSTVGSEIGNLLKWKNFYGHIVLILECSWPINGTALGWRMLYGRMFRNVVLLSSKSDASFGVEANEDWQTFKLLGEIFERYPDAEGFLFMRDNVILNYWNLLQANKTKLWNLHKVNQAWSLVRHDDRNGTEWYYKSSIKRTVKNMLKILPIHFQMCYKENIDDTHFIVSKSEVFYIPQRLVSDFAELVPLAVQAKLHPDLAFPLFFLAMEPIDDYDSEAFSSVVYNTGSDATYTAEPHIVRQPFAAAMNQSQLLHLVKAMASGDPLLLEAL